MEIIIIIVAVVCVCILTALLKRGRQDAQTDIEAIEKLLPQTQCGDCGFDSCRPYAEALLNRNADINRCLPGGTETVEALSSLLGVAVKPLYKKSEKYKIPKIALIDEQHCIGCTKCIPACPVDAIIGAPKQMHSVINEHCTGCWRCVSPCPTDCISMVASMNEPA